MTLCMSDTRSKNDGAYSCAWCPLTVPDASLALMLSPVQPIVFVPYRQDTASLRVPNERQTEPNRCITITTGRDHSQLCMCLGHPGVLYTSASKCRFVSYVS